MPVFFVLNSFCRFWRLHRRYCPNLSNSARTFRAIFFVYFLFCLLLLLLLFFFFAGIIARNLVHWGSQWEHRIRFILPTGTASNIINLYMASYTLSNTINSCETPSTPRVAGAPYFLIKSTIHSRMTLCSRSTRHFP